MSSKIVERLLHIKSHIEGDAGIDDRINNIATGHGSPAGSARNMKSYCLARAIQAWFEFVDLVAMKQWFYLFGEFQRRLLELEIDQMNLMAKVTSFGFVMMSDNEDLVSSFCQVANIYDLAAIGRVTSPDFHGFNIVLAARGEMALLGERCAAFRSGPQKGAVAKYSLDNEFLAALAKGDHGKMEAVLNELVTPKIARSRAGLESGYTKDLVSSLVTIYAKLAWRRGFEVKVDSPLVSAEWLPVRPLESYDPTYEIFR